MSEKLSQNVETQNIKKNALNADTQSIKIKEILSCQRAYFFRGETFNVDYRIEKLKDLKKCILKYEADITAALKADLNKAPLEAYETELGMILEELNHTIRHLKAWSKKEKAKVPLISFRLTSYAVWEPYGIVLIMSPWNYPFQLALAPLIGSIAAGNCAVVKPSAYSPNTSAIIAKILSECFNENYVAVIEGGREANQALLLEKFDYIFFTGSVDVGRLVMEAASKNLTPVTLELGGKSPCIVANDADLEVTARRIVWGKFLNAGQTCVAPDYLLVQKGAKAELFEHMKKYIKQFYGDNPCNNDDFPRIINIKHFHRLKGLLSNGKIITGGNSDEAFLKIAPTILDNIRWSDEIMQEEIFGPILPVLEYDNLSEIIHLINSRPKPLALYLFTTNHDTEQKIVQSISFGGGCINDTIIHVSSPHIPFGGVGDSGMGGYHGKWSFETFSHKKGILKNLGSSDISLRFPPYNDKKLMLVKKILK